MTTDPTAVDQAPILITGGAGFVGSALVSELLRRGRRVVTLDIADPRDRLGIDSPLLTVVRGDVRDTALVRSLVEQSSLVLHLAAVVGVDDYIQRPHDVLDVNIQGSRNVLVACHELDRPVLLVSTSEVYGRNSAILREDADSVIGPISKSRWAYAISKLTSEQMAHALGKQGLCYTIVRYFNVYGPLIDAPGQGRVVSKFLGCLRDGRPLPLVDGGPAIRSYCYVDDAVEATLLLALGLRRDAPFQGRAVNVGRDEAVSVAELARMVLRLSGHPHGTVDIPGEKFFGAGFEEIPVRIPDVSFLAETTGFRARITLEEGLRRTLAHWGYAKEGATAGDRDVLPTIRPQFEPDERLLSTYRGLLRSGKVSNDGAVLQRFEREVSAYLGVEHAAVVGNGAMALLLAVKALGLKGRVVLPSFTYVATLSAFTLEGLEPIFCDVDPETFTLSPEALARIADAGGFDVVCPVNAYGVPADLAAIEAIARRVGATVVYDDAHGFGTVQDGRRVPRGAAASTYSFHATKILPAIEGGLVVSEDAALIREVRRLRNHGLRPDLLATTPAYNARMDELRAATALHALSSFGEVLARRRTYGERLRGFIEREAPGAFALQRIPDGVTTNFQNLPVVCRLPTGVTIDDVVAHFRSEGIEARRYFYPALHELEMFRGRAPSLPVTERLARGLVCLPFYSRMSDADLSRVEAAVRSTARRFAA